MSAPRVVATHRRSTGEGTSRLCVLLIAYACDPYRGSEEGVGWGWARAIAREHEVHVLTADFNREPIERHLAGSDEGARGIRFHYVRNRRYHYHPGSRLWRRIEHSLAKPLMNIAYSLWQNDAYRVAHRLVAEQEYDLVHLVTYVGFRFAGRFWDLEAPLIWGPVGGLENTPWRLLPMLGASGAVFYAGRNVVNSLQKRLLPNPKRAFRKASGGVIAATSGMREEILRHYGVDSVVISEIGLPSVPARGITLREPAEPLRIGWSGRHIPGKALPILLHALAQLSPEVRWELHAFGDGPCTLQWKELARRLGLASRCVWTGWLPRAEALAGMARLHLQAITSLQDLTSTVTVEALTQGVPVLCLDHCGFRDAIDDTCGWKVPLASRAEMSGGFARALTVIWRDEGERRTRAAGALRRAGAHSWEAKLEQISRIYEAKLSSRAVPVSPQGAPAVQESRVPRGASLR